MRQQIWTATVVTAVMAASIAHGEDNRSTRESKAAQDARATGERIKSYTADLFRATESNTNFRRVLFTGQRSQLVAMSIPPGESIGAEKHPHVEQTIVILSGSGRAVLDGRRTKVGGGDVIVVTPGTDHNLENIGTTPLQLFTSYVPPNHIPGRVHATKKDAERDTEDEKFGEQAR